MDSDKKTEKLFEDYLNVAKENKNVDVASLMLNAIQKSDKNLVSSKTKKWAYLISIGVPPFGLLFALKFYFFSEEEDAKNVGNICLILTIISIVFFVIITKMMFSGSGTSLKQIEQIKPQDIQGLY